MNLSFRSFIKRKIPMRAKALVQRVRRAAEAPPIDDVVLSDYQLEADPSEQIRLNLVIPNLASSSAFGGVTTGLEIVLRLLIALRKSGDIDFRVIFTEPDRETDVSILEAAAQRLDIDDVDADFLEIAGPTHTVRVRRGDVFVTYNWWTTLNAQRLVDAQAAHFGDRAKPLIYLIQEYEPQIFPLSSAHMLSREAYDTPARLWGVFNSSNLFDYFSVQGHRVEKSFVFEPVINNKLRGYLDQVGGSERRKQILVYGRPGVRRNCFPALVRGLRAWVSAYPEFADWSVVSAGTPHRPVELGDGRQMTSVGKLSLEDYAQTLLTSSVGVSLMASPHPSYPPLEMAHMGLHTVTNSYLCKDLTDFHPNIVSIASIAEENLAGAIAQACRSSQEAPVGVPNAEFVRQEPYRFIDQLAAELRANID